MRLKQIILAIIKEQLCNESVGSNLSQLKTAIATALHQNNINGYFQTLNSTEITLSITGYKLFRISDNPGWPARNHHAARNAEISLTYGEAKNGQYPTLFYASPSYFSTATATAQLQTKIYNDIQHFFNHLPSPDELKSFKPKIY